jgi:N,N'-diacetyllegionaminate synthase
MVLFSKNNVFVIAEMANAHEGKLDIAKKIVEKASQSNADGIKFQRFTANELVTKDHKNYDMYKMLEMQNKEWNELIKFSKDLKLRVFVDIFGLNSAKKLLATKIDGYKIHSSDMGNPQILQFVSKVKQAVLLSAGGSYPNEIEEAIKIIAKTNKEIAIMHGFQGYPTRILDINLNRIFILREKFDLPIGIMDHLSGDLHMAKILPSIAVGMGVKIVEKHITLDRSKKGSDYFSSMNPDEFKEMVKIIRQTENSMGRKTFDLSKNEITYRNNHKKRPIAKTTIKKGTEFETKILEFKRTNVKSRVLTFEEIRGKHSSKKIEKKSAITQNMIDKTSHKIAAIIACRVNSSRLYAKQMQLIDNKPIIEHMIFQIRKSKLIDEIVLAISEDIGNEIFIDFAKKHKIKFVVGNDTNVLLRLINAAKYVNADILFRITPENPYIYWEGIDDLIKKHIDGRYDFSDWHSLPEGSGYEIINLKTLDKSHKDGKKKHRSEFCSLYIHENQKKFKIFHAMPLKKLQRPELRITVDTPEDLFVARAIHEKLGNKIPISLTKIIKVLDENPEIKKFNSSVLLGDSRIWI